VLATTRDGSRPSSATRPGQPNAGVRGYLGKEHGGSSPEAIEGIVAAWWREVGRSRWDAEGSVGIFDDFQIECPRTGADGDRGKNKDMLREVGRLECDDRSILVYFLVFRTTVQNEIRACEACRDCSTSLLKVGNTIRRAFHDAGMP